MKRVKNKCQQLTFVFAALSLPARGSVPGAGNNGQTDIFGPQEMQLGYANVLSASNQSQNNSQRNRIPQNR